MHIDILHPSWTTAARALLLFGALGAFTACDLFDDDPVPSPGIGQVCAGFAGIPCPDGLLCDPEPGQCNTDDVAGACVLVVGDVCTTEFVPVCGCDGVTYGNDCLRLVARVAKDHDGVCDPVGDPKG